MIRLSGAQEVYVVKAIIVAVSRKETKIDTFQILWSLCEKKRKAIALNSTNTATIGVKSPLMQGSTAGKRSVATRTPLDIGLKSLPRLSLTHCSRTFARIAVASFLELSYLLLAYSIALYIGCFHKLWVCGGLKEGKVLLANWC